MLQGGEIFFVGVVLPVKLIESFRKDLPCMRIGQSYDGVIDGNVNIPGEDLRAGISYGRCAHAPRPALSRERCASA